MVKVTEADSRAAEYLAAIIPTMPNLAERVIANTCALTRCFAAHRAKARIAALEEAVGAIKALHGGVGSEMDAWIACGLDNALEAVRALIDGPK